VGGSGLATGGDAGGIFSRTLNSLFPKNNRENFIFPISAPARDARSH
jgi:hypothetical protein